MGLKPEIKQYLAQRAQLGLPLVWQAPLSEVRESTYSHIALSQPLIDLFEVKRILIPGPKSDLPVRIYRPNQEFNLPALVFFHGGGWKNGNYKAFKRQCSYLASRGMVAISADYRIKSLHHTTPFEAVQDAKSAIRFVRKNPSALSIDPNKIASGGGSAGGHLAAVCGIIEGFDDPNENLTISSKPNALVLFNPVYDNSKEGYGYSIFKDRYMEISPLHNITIGAPPTVVFFGTKDKTTPVKSSEEFKTKMKAVGSRCDLFLFEGQEHSFFNKGTYFNKTLFETDLFLLSLGYLSGKPTIN